MRRLLIGGCGDLGSRVALLALARGVAVHAVRRSVAALPPGVAGSAVDLCDPDPVAWLARIEPCDALLWCPTPAERTPAGYRAIYVNALRAVLAVTRALGWPLQRCVLAGSTAVYAEDGGSHDERSSAWSTQWNAVELRAAEQVLQAQGAGAVCARLGGIYGPGRTRLLRLVRAGAPCQAEPPRPTNRIHVDDAAAALLLLLQLPQAEPACNVVDPEGAAEHEVRDWLAARLGLPPPPRAAAATPGKRVLPAVLQRLGFDWRHPGYRSGYGTLLADPSVRTGS